MDRKAQILQQCLDAVDAHRLVQHILRRQKRLTLWLRLRRAVNYVVALPAACSVVRRDRGCAYLRPPQPHPDNLRWQVLDHGYPRAHPHNQRHARLCPGVSEIRRDNPLLHDSLERLRDAHGQLSPPLDAREVADLDVSASERRPEEIGGFDRVLDSNIDTHARHRRHGVCRVTDAQQPWPVPPSQPVGAYAQQFDLVPILEFRGTIGEVRNSSREGPPKRVETFSPDALVRTLGDDVRDLPVVSPIDEHKEVPWCDTQFG